MSVSSVRDIYPLRDVDPAYCGIHERQRADCHWYCKLPERAEFDEMVDAVADRIVVAVARQSEARR